MTTVNEHRDADPDRRPEQRLADRELGRLAVQDAQVEDQQPEEQGEESAPDQLRPWRADSSDRGCPDALTHALQGMSSTASFSFCTGSRSRAVSLRSSASALAM